MKDPNSAEKSSEGRYANYFEVGHNAFEFVVNFGQFFAEGGDPELHTKIITSPVYAKRLQQVLDDAVDRYEQAFGPIPNWPEV
ncbi:hypothetical protein SBA3_2220030 [Candidatus Sulfopaludibacter sp. SbA3]|nr:hypothetical protein SBA3_2220030 [Candidatus Sulfopaludibacter sp. SbA3]